MTDDHRPRCAELGRRWCLLGQWCGLWSRRRLLGADAGRVDRSIRTDRHRCSFAFRHLVQNEAFPFGVDAQNQPPGLGADDQVALPVHLERPRVGLLALEEHRTLAVGRHAMDFSGVAGADVKVAVGSEGHGPDVFLLGVVEDFGLGVGVAGTIEAVDLAVRRSGDVHPILLVDNDGVDFQGVELGDLAAAAIGIDAEEARVGTATGIDDSVRIAGEGPQIGAGGIEELFRDGRQAKTAVATH